VAVTLIACVPPLHIVLPVGCEVMLGSGTTVTATALLVTDVHPLPVALTTTL
jgi:hypothetical protein